MSLAEKHDHPEIKVGRQYLCRIGGKWFMGRFNKLWYGLNFDGWYAAAGLQFNAPGWNCSSWERVFEMEGLTGTAWKPHCTSG